MERESLQALQPHLPRKQSPLFWWGLFISRFRLLADVHRPDLRRYCRAGVLCEGVEELRWGWDGQEMGIRPSWYHALVCTCTAMNSLAKIFAHGYTWVTHPHCASQMPPSYCLHLAWQRCSCHHFTISGLFCRVNCHLPKSYATAHFYSPLGWWKEGDTAWHTEYSVSTRMQEHICAHPQQPLPTYLYKQKPFGTNVYESK